MNMFKLFDVVALVAAIPDEGLERGQVGTIIEIYNNGEAYEVEFSDHRNGHTYAMLALNAEQLMMLHYQPVHE
jgi:hypothetical protein